MALCPPLTPRILAIGSAPLKAKLEPGYRPGVVIERAGESFPLKQPSMLLFSALVGFPMEMIRQD